MNHDEARDDEEHVHAGSPGQIAEAVEERGCPARAGRRIVPRMEHGDREGCEAAQNLNEKELRQPPDPKMSPALLSAIPGGWNPEPVSPWQGTRAEQVAGKRRHRLSYVKTWPSLSKKSP
jgi:hypothetical protein